MQFFYEAVLEVNRENADVLEDDASLAETDSTERQEGTGGGDGDTDEVNSGRVSGTVWLSAVEAVSDLTKYNWREVFQMSALEFFTFLRYVNYKRAKEQRELRKLMKKH